MDITKTIFCHRGHKIHLHPPLLIPTHKKGRMRSVSAQPATCTAVLFLFQFCNHLVSISHQRMFWVIANKSL